VPSITIDDISRAYDFQDVQILKMDIEGAEIVTLDGASQLLQQNQQLMIIFEANYWGCWKFNYRTPSVLKKVGDYGFDLYLFQQNRLVPRQSSVSGKRLLGLSRSSK